MIMSKFCIYLNLPPYLSQWLAHSFGSPVEFPTNSNECAIIRTFVQRLPTGTLPDTARNGNVAVVIPSSKAKPPMYYNYLSPRGKSALAEAIMDLFRRNLWAELSRLDMSSRLNSKILAWCEMHGIDIDHADTVRQKFYRMRNSYNRKGIFLGK